MYFWVWRLRFTEPIASLKMIGTIGFHICIYSIQEPGSYVKWFSLSNIQNSNNRC